MFIVGKKTKSLEKSHKLVFQLEAAEEEELNEHIRNVGFILQMKFSTTTQPGVEFFDLQNKPAWAGPLNSQAHLPSHYLIIELILFTPPLLTI